jgi:uncharacterized caspase-like protein
MKRNDFHIAIILGGLALLLSVIAAHAEKRVALVIGNATYKSTPALANPGNDAEDIATTLRRVGFTVALEQNLDKRGMERAIAQFGRDARDADAALFYYAGHGMQYRGLNYLMPVDAKLEDQFSLNSEMTRVDDVLSSLEQARGVKILVLDACRRNPLVDRMAGVATTRDFVPNRGLARLDATRGMVVAYATQPDQIAVDGTGRNSPFTAALVRQINEPGLEIGTLFRRVAADVNKATAGRQLPELSVSLLGEFYFTRADSDVQAWSKVRGSQDPAQFRDFLSRYPSSPLAAEIRERLDAIERVDRERVDRERSEQERLERERLAREQAERTQRAQEERQRLEHERLAQEQVNRERLAREDAERVAREQAQRERAKKDAATNPQADIQIATLEPPPQPSVVAPPVASPLVGGKLVQEIKKELKRVGCYTGRIDDRWTASDTKSSVQRFVKYARLPSPTDEPGMGLLDAIRGKSERVCPLECNAREIEKDGQCVTKTCPADQRLAVDGNCASVARGAPAVAKPTPPLRNSESQGSGHKCFVLGGKSYCE